MTVANNQPVEASVTNAAYLSKITDNVVIAKINLRSPSSADVDDIQQIINDLLNEVDGLQTEIDDLTDEIAEMKGGYLVSSQTLDDGEFVVLDSYKAMHINLQSDLGAKVLSSTPFGAITDNFFDGQTIRLMGLSDTNTVEIGNNNIQYGAILNGKWISKMGYILELTYNASLERFIEVNRNF